MAQNFRSKHKNRIKPSKVGSEHVSPRKQPKKRGTHSDNSSKKKNVKENPLNMERESVPFWVFKKLNVTGWDELDKVFEEEYIDAVRKNRAPFSGNVFVNFWYDEKMKIEDIKESLRVRWLAQNSAPYGRLWNIVYDEMKRRYGSKVADRIGVPNGKRFKEDLAADPHEDEELFLHSDKFKNAFEKAVKIPLSNWRVMTHGGKKVERMEFMCRIFIDERMETMLGCFERRIKKNPFERHGGSSVGMYGYFRGDNTKRFTVRRQDYKPAHPHKNKLMEGQVRHQKRREECELFALDLYDVPKTKSSHEHNYTLSQRLFTNVRFPVDTEPTDRSKHGEDEYVYETFDEMTAEFMKNKNLLMVEIPMFEIQKESVVKLAEKYCPAYDVTYNSNSEIPKALKREIDTVQGALIKVGKPPYTPNTNLEKIYNLSEEGGKKTFAKDKKDKMVREFVESKRSKDDRNADCLADGQKEEFVPKSSAIQNLRNTEKRHKKKKSNSKNGSHEFDDVGSKAKEVVGEMREFIKQKRKLAKRKSSRGRKVDEEFYLAMNGKFDEEQQFEDEKPLEEQTLRGQPIEEVEGGGCSSKEIVEPIPMGNVKAGPLKVEFGQTENAVADGFEQTGNGGGEHAD